MHRANRQRGHILVEFILVAPVILAIAGGALEIARFLRLNQTASIISQEAAVSAYRKCSDFFVFDANGAFNQGETTSDIQKCLETVRSDLQKQLEDLYNPALPGNPKFSLVLSVYRRDNVRNSAGTELGFKQLTQIVPVPPDPTPTPLPSLYKATGGTIQKIGPPAAVVVNAGEVQKMERIVIAEVAYEYTPVIPIYKVLLGQGDFLRTGEGFRETTIL